MQEPQSASGAPTTLRPGRPKCALGVLCLLAGLTGGAVAGAGPAAPAAAATPAIATPTVEGPILPSSGISYLGSTTFSPSAVGYEQSEFFLSGTATAYTSATPLSANGRWHVTPAATAPYTTRVVVYRPVDPARFDGTVVVEWLNVTGGIDAPAAWLNAHVQMIRDGMAFVGVDAQAAGIYGQAGSIAAADGAGGIKQMDPTRYAPLNHPGDSFSYSIYAQAGQALRSDGTRLLGGLTPKHVIALGESQSAFRLVTYIDAIAPLAPHVYDAYFVYSRGSDGADLSQSPQATIATPTPTYIRTDLHVPVFLFETESDLLGLGYLAARQPPTPEIREWETAGTAHDDTYGLLYSRSDTGSGAADSEAFASMLNPPKDPIPGIVDCAAPINAGSHTYELRAALQAVNRWVTTGQAPVQSPRLKVDPSDHSKFLTDANGNALGGIRSPQVAAPVATLSGVGQPGAPAVPANAGSATGAVSGQLLCGIFGTTTPFSAAKLAALYPTHADFVKKWDAATSAEVKEGYLLPADAATLDRVAAESSVGG
ncbi:MAG TPA: alpha/beta hydrolase domain-containing protein [Acidimicrobiales bacterium]|nr:alpha/beta hydrolase domain-containing protein [Acidimicrobiales bacterium]